MTRVSPSAKITRAEILNLFDLPFMDLIFRAHGVHRSHWNPHTIQMSSLVSVKTGKCPEDCGYCAQSAHHKVKLDVSGLLSLDDVIKAARSAQSNGITRLCLSAAWRELKDRDMDLAIRMVAEIKKLGLETCLTMGMLTKKQAEQLRQSGLDYYNHNVDSSEEFYQKIVTTRKYKDRLNTLQTIRAAGLKVCSGGIVGMGETRSDRAGMLETLVHFSPPPESIPINMLIPIKGTPLENTPSIDPFEVVRTIAVTRILAPDSYVRLSAGRKELDDGIQALCFFAGANSLFYGNKLLTTPNVDKDYDMAMLKRLNLLPEIQSAPS